ncbi:TPA: hypothetical protein ACH3X1_013630 [Trebouxia sp. C0004]
MAIQCCVPRFLCHDRRMPHPDQLRLQAWTGGVRRPQSVFADGAASVALQSRLKAGMCQGHLPAFALSLQLLNLIPFAWRASAAYPQTPRAWVNKLLDTLTYSAPASIPTIFLVITYIARMRLDKAGISLLYSKALHVGAYVNMVCFDKTGTLTDSVAALHGVLPVHKGQFESLQQNVLRPNNLVWQALAVAVESTDLCEAALHGVLPVHKGQFESLQQNAQRWSNRQRQALAIAGESTDCVICTFAGSFARRAASA